MQGHSTKGYIAGSDAVRAAACLWVFAAHLLNFAPELKHSSHPLIQFISRGYLGVPVFFVLSGFLLSRPFWCNYLQNNGLPDIKAYSIRRLTRITPEFYLCLAIVALVAGMLSYQWGCLHVFSCATFTSHLFPAFHTPLFNTPLWTIPVEMTFYLLLPITFLPLFKYRRRINSTLYLLGIVIFIMTIQQAFLYIAPAITRLIDEPAFFNHTSQATTKNALVLYCHFLIGVLAGKIHLSMQLASTDSRKWNIYDVACCGMLFVCAVLGCTGLFKRYLGLSFMYYNWPMFSIFVAAMLICLPRTALLNRLCEVRFFYLTAMYSYGIYLWHVPIMGYLSHYWPRNSNGQLMWLPCYVITALACSYLVAAASYHLVGHPARQWAMSVISNREKQLVSRTVLSATGRQSLKAA